MHATKQSLPYLCAFLLAFGFGTQASAIDLGGLKDAAGGLDVGSLTSGSVGNAAGVIEFCVKNNYLKGDLASTVKDGLMSKLGAGEAQAEPQQDEGYLAGAKGLLKAGDGRNVNLADFGDLKRSLTEKACDSVLQHAKSLL